MQELPVNRNWEEDCARCGQKVEDVHPLGWVSFTIDGPVMANPQGALLCAECVMSFGEWLYPHLKGVAAWISESDQLRAEIKRRKQ